MPKAFTTGATAVSRLLNLFEANSPYRQQIADAYNWNTSTKNVRRMKPPFPSYTICVELSTEDLERQIQLVGPVTGALLRKAFNVPSPQN